MNELRIVLLALGLLCLLAPAALAGPAPGYATQTVNFEVQAVNAITVTGNPGKLTVSTATAGQEPDEVSDSSTGYDLTTNGTGMRITGALDSDMPSGVTLKAHLSAPTGGTSAGDVELSSLARNVVTGITEVVANELGITYKLDAVVDAGIVASTTRTVTFTVVGGVG